MENIEPKLMSSEELMKLYRIYDMTGQLFEGSHIRRLFAHIIALHQSLKVQSEIMTVVCGAEELNKEIEAER